MSSARAVEPSAPPLPEDSSSNIFYSVESGSVNISVFNDELFHDVELEQKLPPTNVAERELHQSKWLKVLNIVWITILVLLFASFIVALGLLFFTNLI
ncbi:unnamed protein product [Auanema sp. JU1783]|nr:unnamed protein product [Auanema sp. JU1783]